MTPPKTDKPINSRSEETICEACGVLTVAWQGKTVADRRLVEVRHKRDYYPISFLIRLRPDTATSYIVTPKLEHLLRALPFFRIRSIGGGKLDYAIDVSLPNNQSIPSLLSADERIETWHTAESAPVCDCHTCFVGDRW